MMTELLHQTRKRSLLSFEANLESLHVFKKFPVFIGATDSPAEDDLFFDMSWDICQNTGIIQLRDLLDPSLIYSGYHSEAVGGVWLEHHDQFCDFAGSFIGKNIVEIGGSNGSVARRFLKQNSKIEKYTIVEPNPNCDSDGRLEVVNAFFDSDWVRQFSGETDTVIHSHTFEHMFDPIEFVSAISALLPNGGMQIFSIPTLESYLENKFANTLNFEHTFYLTLEITQHLLQNAGFEILETATFKDHSTYFACRKVEGLKPSTLVNRYKENKQTFIDFVQHYDDEILTLNRRIEAHTGEVYLFGGHIFSQFLLNAGLLSGRIKAILDNSSEKIGRRLYGTDKIICEPNLIVDQNNVAVILKAGQYQDEIRSQLLGINPNCLIWE